MEDHRAVQFVFDDDDADLVEADVDIEEVHPGQEYDVKAQTAELLDKIKEALNDASTPGEIMQLNNELVDLQSQIISANASKVKAREERNKGVYETVLTAECVDLCFVVDATASMRKTILMVSRWRWRGFVLRNNSLLTLKTGRSRTTFELSFAKSSAPTPP